MKICAVDFGLRTKKDNHEAEREMRSWEVSFSSVLKVEKETHKRSIALFVSSHENIDSKI